MCACLSVLTRQRARGRPKEGPSHAPAAVLIPLTRILPRSRDVSRVTPAVRDQAAALIHDIRPKLKPNAKEI